MDLVVAHCYLGHFKKLRIIIIMRWFLTFNIVVCLQLSVFDNESVLHQ